MANIFIGRQPIFDRKLNVIAYELLYRHADVDRAIISDADAASSEVVVNSLIDVGLDRLVGHAKAYCNFTRGFLLKGAGVRLAPDQLVIEVLETVRPEPEVLAALAQFSAAGHQIALDDFVLSDETQALVACADIVKIDILAQSRTQVASQVLRLRDIKDLKLLAEKVETHEDFQYCMKLGFDYFQGFFFSKPQVVSGSTIAPSRLAMLRLMAEIQRPEINMEVLQQIIETDVNLCVKLLRQINSCFYSLLSQIRSVRQAILYLGVMHIRNWACVVSLGAIDDKPKEVVTMSLVRAKMCEVIGGAEDADRSSEFFTVGLFSLLDTIFDTTLEEVLEQMPLDLEIREALLQRKGRLGVILACVEAHEKGQWDVVERHGYGQKLIMDAYLEALGWARTVQDNMGA
ncbi:MAG: HDOD domain-containing protein [Desulfuromonadaceae bacterium]|nr:HDOD domain-containing protein [Desulfuromonadaceae bacterium]